MQGREHYVDWKKTGNIAFLVWRAFCTTFDFLLLMSNNHFLSDPSPIIVYPCFSLSHSCLVNLTDVTLAVEDQTNLASNASFFRGGLFRAEGKELYMMIFKYPAPLFSSEMKKCQQANWSCCSMKSFIWKSVWLARWPFLALNKGVQLRKSPCMKCRARKDFIDSIYSVGTTQTMVAGSSFFIFPISKNSVPPVHSWGWFKVNSVGGTVFGGA